MKIARGLIAVLLLSSACSLGSQDDSACGCGSPHPINVAGGMSVAESGAATLVYPSGAIELTDGSYVPDDKAFTVEDGGDAFGIVRVRRSPRSYADAALGSDAGEEDAAIDAAASDGSDASENDADIDAGDAGDARDDAAIDAGDASVSSPGATPPAFIMWIESVEGGPHVVLCSDPEEVLSRTDDGSWVCTNGAVTTPTRTEVASVTATRTNTARGGSTLSLFVNTPSGIRVNVTVVTTYTESHVDQNCY